MKRSTISTTRLAEICGVSQGTVDRALNNRKGISAKTKEKILKVAKEYGYRPNIHATSLAGGKSHLIGVVVFDLENEYFSEILTGIEKYCTQKGYSIVVMMTDKNPEKEIECIDNLYQMSIDGIVICPINKGEEYENYLLSLEIPIVTIGNKLDRIPYAGIDNAAAMVETVEHVLINGYERLIYVKPGAGDKNDFAQTARLNAFLEVCTKYNTEFCVTDMENVAEEMDSDRKKAIICPIDIYALRLLNSAKEKKAGIIGFDNIRIIDELALKLDSVAYDISGTAKVASDYIIDGKPISSTIPHKLIKRGSI